MMASTLSDAEHKKRRAADYAKWKDYEGARARYVRAIEALKQAEEPVSRGELTRLSLVPFEDEVTATAQAVNEISEIRNRLQNSCRDRSLKDRWEVSRSLQSVAQADHARAAQALKSEENSLAILISGISQLLGKPSVIQEGDPKPWDAGVIARTVSALKIAFGSAEIPKWAISADRQNVAFSPEVHATNVKHYADSWHGTMRDIRLAQASCDETARRLAEAQAAFAEVKLAMIESPV